MVDFSLADRVPYVSQLGFGDPTDLRSEETGCWFASSSMIGFYFEAGPRLGVPSQYSQNKVTAHGVSYKAPTRMNVNYPVLAANEDLVPVPHPKPPAWTCADLVHLLKRRGPLFMRRGFIESGKLNRCHIVVLVGARESDNRVICHDPGKGGLKWQCKIDYFNKIFKWNDRYSKYSLMYRRPALYAAAGATRTVAELTGAFGGSIFH